MTPMAAFRRLVAPVALVLLGCLVAGQARAADPAPADDPPAPAPATPPAAPPAPPPSDDPTPRAAYEAQDTAPPSGVAPAPEQPTPAPDLGLGAPAPAPRHQPIYQKDWFWISIAVVAVTVAIVGTLALAGNDPATPPTTLGDMRAF
jgi:hypothetical protein